MVSCLPETYHGFFTALSETAMFDEYVRNKIVGAFKNVEIVDNKQGFMIIHRKKSNQQPQGSSREKGQFLETFSKK